MQQLQLDVIQIKLLIRLFNVSKCPHFLEYQLFYFCKYL